MELIGALLGLVVLYTIGYWTARLLGFAIKAGCLIILGLLAITALAIVAGLIELSG